MLLLLLLRGDETEQLMMDNNRIEMESVKDMAGD